MATSPADFDFSSKYNRYLKSVFLKSGYVAYANIKGNRIVLSYPERKNGIKLQSAQFEFHIDNNRIRDYPEIPSYCVYPYLAAFIVIECVRRGYPTNFFDFRVSGKSVREVEFADSIPIRLNQKEKEKMARLIDFVIKLGAQFVLRQKLQKIPLGEDISTSYAIIRNLFVERSNHE